METEITILALVAMTFIAGVVGGLVIADSFDTHETHRQRRRKQRRKERTERRRRMATPNPRR